MSNIFITLMSHKCAKIKKQKLETGHLKIVMLTEKGLKGW